MSVISVIVPVYNVEQYLERCVKSILTQSFSDFELILVDDGSPDNCGALCDRYAEEDSRVKVIHQRNMGLSAARNAGLDWVDINSNSKWVCFIDSDDWVYVDFLGAMIRCAENTGTYIVISDFATTNGIEPIINRDSLRGAVVKLDDFYISHTETATTAWGILYHRECLKNARFPVGKIHEDVYYTYKVLFECGNVSYIDQPMYFYYQSPESIMRRKWNPKRLDAIPGFEEQIVYFKDNPRIKAHLVKRYIDYLYNTQFSLSEKYPEFGEYVELLKKKLRHTLIKHRKTIDWESVPYAAELCFPRYMKVYWIVKAQINKIHAHK